MALIIEALDAQTDLQQVKIALVENAIDVGESRAALDAARGRR